MEKIIKDGYQIGDFYLKYSKDHERYDIIHKIYNAPSGMTHEYSLGYFQLYESDYVFICHPSIRYSHDDIGIIKQFMEFMCEGDVLL